MKRLFLVAKLALVTICVSSLAFGANIKVVCKNDPKHDRAKLIQAMNTAKSGDKIVIIGKCAPKGVQASARKAYQSNLGGVMILESSRPREYNSWKFDREIQYSPVYDRPLPAAVIIAPGVSGKAAPGRPVAAPAKAGRSAGVSTSKSTTTRSASTKSTSSKSTVSKKEEAKAEEKDKASDEEKAKEEDMDKEKAADEENAKEEENAPEENANDEGNANGEENVAPEEESAPEQSEPAESDGGSDSGDDSSADSGDDSSGGDFGDDSGGDSGGSDE